MNDFSIMESLLKLKQNNRIPEYIDSNNVMYIAENYDEDQLRNLLRRGLILDKNKIINLFFIENVGFRCSNQRPDRYGNIPACKWIEKYMNNLYLESFN